MKSIIPLMPLVFALHAGAAESRISTSTSTSTQRDGRVVVTVEKDGKKETRTWQMAPPRVLSVGSPLKQTKEKVAHLGVALGEPSEDLARHLGLQGGAGVLAAQVLRDSPADRAGLREHDVLVKIDDQLLFNVEQTVALIRSLKPGREVRISYFRAGAQNTVTAKLVEKEMVVFDNLAGSSAALPRVQPFALNLGTNMSIVTPPLMVSTNNFHYQFVPDVAGQIRQAFEQSAAIAATNPLFGHRAVLITKAGGNTLVQELAEVHAKVKLTVEQSLKASAVADEVREKVLGDLDRFLADSVPQ